MDSSRHACYTLCMAQSLVTQGIKYVAVDLVGGVVGFPLWWYGRGLVAWTQGVWDWFLGYRASLAVGVWVKNLFVPMYGTYDIGGRLISFFMRVSMIILKSVALLFSAALLFAIWVIYLALPLLVLGMILYHGLGILE